MSEKKDISSAAPYDDAEPGELYGVKTNPNPTDAVFGEVSEDGPNFKSVRVPTREPKAAIPQVCAVCEADIIPMC